VCHRWRILTGLSLVCAALSGGGLAHAEFTQKGGVRLKLNAELRPHTLPRERLAPVSVYLEGAITPLEGGRPPTLTGLSIALNGQGRIDPRGLASCRVGELEQTSSAEALTRCRAALIGHGWMESRLYLPSGPLSAPGELLAFNTTIGGAPGILLHAYTKAPFATTSVLPLRLRPSHDGTFGTLVSTRFPRIAAGLGSVEALKLTLGRRFRVEGSRHSYLRADCAAPSGINVVSFPFARGSFTFANGLQLSETLLRSCSVSRTGKRSATN
jgi:hypothetical protein